ncbi:hypothetical protein [Sulfurimonas sp.]
MNKVLKYENLKDRFPRLQNGLLNSIQSEFLEIKKIKLQCDSYENACNHYPNLKNAYCVIYSPYIDKKDHDYEMFIFIDDQGEILEHISGRDMALYGMLEQVNELRINSEYEYK